MTRLFFRTYLASYCMTDCLPAYHHLLGDTFASPISCVISWTSSWHDHRLFGCSGRYVGQWVCTLRCLGVLLWDLPIFWSEMCWWYLYKIILHSSQVRLGLRHTVVSTKYIIVIIFCERLKEENLCLTNKNYIRKIAVSLFPLPI